ncbi:AFG1/ZapE family ATPase [Tumebacillus permanentifrigoris]|uniref:Replicative DNA helicase loader DnaI n=1 Tax=Tumebacillus permanentifrigoris TaxID=378543 RepID=A0A316D6A1_9BACL|nr:AFG1/ZapE family ATPase [Tumebacillus permanentifrigoris]PWK10193.1 replicative DNA helicase loader DnaI [Tumebacillus permanentifrigoris]
MEHIGEIAMPTSGNFALARTIQILRELLPELADIDDGVIRKRGGDILDAANCRENCRRCTDFAGCWRDDEAKGHVTILTVKDGEIKLQRGVHCKPYREQLNRESQERMLIASGMTAKERGFTFENFPEQQRKRHGDILQHAEGFLNGQSKSGLYLWGPPGIAKTHLMLAVMNRLNERGTLAVYVRADRMIDQLRDAIRFNGDVDAVQERYMTAPVLGIDEFAQERLTDYGLESMIKILNARAATGLPTWFTSNFRPDMAYERSYEKYPEQIDALRSRVALLAIPARMAGEDWRLNSYDLMMGPDEEV